MEGGRSFHQVLHWCRHRLTTEDGNVLGKPSSTISGGLFMILEGKESPLNSRFHEVSGEDSLTRKSNSNGGLQIRYLKRVTRT